MDNLQFLASHLLPEIKQSTKHFEALPFIDVPQFMIELRTVEGFPARALEFLILTASRTRPVLLAKSPDIVDSMWIIPADVMKTREPHRVPLSQPALALLEALPRNGEHVFVGDRLAHIGKYTMIRTLHSLRPGLTVHGFRSCFTDWAHE